MFVLEPHDTAWDESAAHCQVITSATHRGQKWSVGVESAEEAGGRLVFQREGGPLLVAINDQLSVYGAREFGLGLYREPYGFRTSFADCWNNQKWGRTLFLNEQVRLRARGERAHFQVVLSPLGSASWRVWKKTEPSAYGMEDVENYAGFYWSPQDARELLLGDASTIQGLLKAQWDDPNSDLSFARRFVLMNKEELHAQIWSWKRGNRMELTRVLRWAFLAQVELWPAPDELQWTVSWQPSAPPHFLGDTFHSPDLLQRFPTPEPLKESLRLALEWFVPTPRYERIALHFSLERSFNRYHSAFVRLAEHPPTAHERLEAALAWRDWLETTRADEGTLEAG